MEACSCGVKCPHQPTTVQARASIDIPCIWTSAFVNGQPWWTVLNLGQVSLTKLLMFELGSIFNMQCRTVLMTRMYGMKGSVSHMHHLNHPLAPSLARLYMKCLYANTSHGFLWVTEVSIRLAGT